jgi:hypothetical protein
VAPCRKINSLPNADAVCKNLQKAPGPFVESINNVNNLFYVDEQVNRFKLTFFQANGASKKSKNKRPGKIQSATMKYLKDLQDSAKDVASGFVNTLNKNGMAGISDTTTLKWTTEHKVIIEGAITE